MSRRKKPRPKKVHKPAPSPQSSKAEATKLEQTAQDTARVFTCDVETAEDCLCECERRLEDLDSDLNYRHVAHDIWKQHSSRAEALVTTMADLITENERHRQAMTDLIQRFEKLAEPRDSHEHIDSPENYFEVVRTQLFGLPPTQ